MEKYYGSFFYPEIETRPISGPDLRHLDLRHEWSEAIQTDNHLIYYKIREAITFGLFERGTSGWPVCVLRCRKGKELGVLSIEPDSTSVKHLLNKAEKEIWIEKMWKLVELCDHWAADVMDCLDFGLLQQPDSVAGLRISNDDILRLRGRTERLIGEQKRKGYNTYTRMQVNDRICLLSNLCINIIKPHTFKLFPENQRLAVSMRQERRLYYFHDPDVEQSEDLRTARRSWRVCPGALVAAMLEKRQMTWLPRQVLEYDPNRYALEKSLARYMFHQWRIRHKTRKYLSPYYVKNLLNAIHVPMNPHHPKRTQEAVQRALDHLVDDGVFDHWGYHQNDQAVIESCEDIRKGWSALWLGTKIIMTPPKWLISALDDVLPRTSYFKRRKTKPTDP